MKSHVRIMLWLTGPIKKNRSQLVCYFTVRLGSGHFKLFFFACKNGILEIMENIDVLSVTYLLN